MNTAMLIIITLSLRRERKGEGDNEGFQGIPPLNILLLKQDRIFLNCIFLSGVIKGKDSP